MRDVEVFDAVMRTGGAGRAADLLGTSQPAVSRTIASLESSCGFALFERVRGRLVPTREGRLFHSEVRQAFLGLGHLRRTAARIREVGEGVLRVASLSALGNTVVARATARFLEQYPQVRVALQIRTSFAVHDLVASGQVDVGLAADEIATTGLDTSVLATPRAVLVVRSDHRLASRREVTAGDLDRERFLSLAPQDTVRIALDRLLATADAAAQIVVETPFSATIANLAALGAGIGLVNPLSLSDPLPSSIRTIAFSPPLFFRTLVLRRAGEPASFLTERFVGLLRAELADA